MRLTAHKATPSAGVAAQPLAAVALDSGPSVGVAVGVGRLAAHLFFSHSGCCWLGSFFRRLRAEAFVINRLGGAPKAGAASRARGWITPVELRDA